MALVRVLLHTPSDILRGSSTVLPLAAAANPRRARLGDHSALVLCGLVLLLGGACDDPHTVRDAAVLDASRDASDPDDDAGAADDDAGTVPTVSRCGYDQRGLVTFSRNGKPLFTAVDGDIDTRTVEATVTEIQAPSESDGWRPLHLRAADEDFEIKVFGVSGFGVDVGQIVQLHWRHDPSVILQNIRLTLRVEDRLAFSYQAFAGELPDGFTREWGAVQCRGDGGCYSWESRKLRLTGPCGDSVELGTSEHGMLCGYEVVPGTLQNDTFVYEPLCRFDDHHARGIELLLVQTGQ